MAKYYFAPVQAKGAKYYWTMGVLATLVLAWLVVSYIRFTNGLYLTGLNHSVTWAGPKVLFVLLVGLSAGSFIVSALSGVFGQKEYKVLSRVAGFNAVLFMVGALSILISDWGRPDRVLLPFYMINPRSLLSLNAFIYTTYIVNGIFYLWALFKENDRATKAFAISATVLAVFVHSGTGFIFAIANGREMLFTPIVPVAFVVAALSSGTAMAIITLYFTFKLTGRTIDNRFFQQLGKIMAGLIIFVVYLMAVEHLMHLYVPQHQAGELYMLAGGNFFTYAFWAGLIGLGGIVPVYLLLNPATRMNIKWILTASGLHIFGVLCERILIILPGQFLPIQLFPGYDVASAFNDGRISSYFPSPIEFTQIAGVVALVVFMYVVGLRMLPLLPVEGKYIKEDGKEESNNATEIAEAVA